MTLREIVDFTDFKCHRCNVMIPRDGIMIHEQQQARVFTLAFSHHGQTDQAIIPHLRAGGLEDMRALGAFIATIKPFSTVEAPKYMPSKLVQSGDRLIRFEE